MKKRDRDASDIQLADLRALVALISFGTVTRAAAELGLSQSVLSHKLERMRRWFADPLFVRVGNRMAPTPLVLRLVEPARQVLRIVETDIRGSAPFDPSTTERVFHIGVNEIGAFALVPRLMQRLAEVAPRAQLSQLLVEPTQLAAALESGAMDLAAGHIPQPDPCLVQRALYRRGYVCIAANNHPRIRRSIGFAQLATERLLQTPGNPITNEWLREQMECAGHPMPAPVQTQHLGAIPFIVAASELVAVIPQEVFELFRPIAAVKMVRLPVQIPPIEIHQYWHPRVASDPANRFFRDFVYRVARE
jgi:DNA-binding transcriptional LysR family regulator